MHSFNNNNEYEISTNSSSLQQHDEDDSGVTRTTRPQHQLPLHHHINNKENYDDNNDGGDNGIINNQNNFDSYSNYNDNKNNKQDIFRMSNNNNKKKLISKNNLSSSQQQQKLLLIKQNSSLGMNSTTSVTATKLSKKVQWLMMFFGISVIVNIHLTMSAMTASSSSSKTSSMSTNNIVDYPILSSLSSFSSSSSSSSSTKKQDQKQREQKQKLSKEELESQSKTTTIEDILREDDKKIEEDNNDNGNIQSSSTDTSSSSSSSSSSSNTETSSSSSLTLQDKIQIYLKNNNVDINEVQKNPKLLSELILTINKDDDDDNEGRPPPITFTHPKKLSYLEALWTGDVTKVIDGNFNKVKITLVISQQDCSTTTTTSSSAEEPSNSNSNNVDWILNKYIKYYESYIDKIYVYTKCTTEEEENEEEKVKDGSTRMTTTTTIENNIPYSKNKHLANIKPVVKELPNVGGYDHTYAYSINNNIEQKTIDPIVSHRLFDAAKGGSSADGNDDDGDEGVVDGNDSDAQHVILFLNDKLSDEYNDGKFRSMADLLRITIHNGFGCATPPIDDSEGTPLSVYHRENFLIQYKARLLRQLYGEPFTSTFAHFRAWMKGALVLDPLKQMDELYVPVCYGGLFGVTMKQLVRSTDRMKENCLNENCGNVWSRFETALSRDDNIEERHFAERTWAMLLSSPLTNIDRALLEKSTIDGGAMGRLKTTVETLKGDKRVIKKIPLKTTNKERMEPSSSSSSNEFVGVNDAIEEQEQQQQQDEQTDDSVVISDNEPSISSIIEKLENLSSRTNDLLQRHNQERLKQKEEEEAKKKQLQSNININMNDVPTEATNNQQQPEEQQQEQRQQQREEAPPRKERPPVPPLSFKSTVSNSKKKMSYLEALWKGDAVYSKKKYEDVKITIVVSWCKEDINWILTEYVQGYEEYVYDIFVYSLCGESFSKDDIQLDGVENAELFVESISKDTGGSTYAYAYFMNRKMQDTSSSFTFTFNEDGEKEGDAVIDEKDKNHIVIFLKDRDKDTLMSKDYRTFEDIIRIGLHNGFACGTLPIKDGDDVYSFYQTVAGLMQYKALRFRQLYGKPFQSAFAHYRAWFKGGLQIEPKQHYGDTYLPLCQANVFAVTKEQFKKASRRLEDNCVLKGGGCRNPWDLLEESLSRGNHIEETHFADRAWAGLLCDKLSGKDSDLLKEASGGKSTLGRIMATDQILQEQARDSTSRKRFR